MKRAPIVLTATAAGLAAALGFHPHTRAPNAIAHTRTTQPTYPSGKTGTGIASTPYGDVQLKVTIASGKIESIEAVQLPSSDPKSQQIASYAEPLLRQSALSKQNGDVDAVSGATYTSEGYKTALQSALDQAGFQASVQSSPSPSA